MWEGMPAWAALVPLAAFMARGVWALTATIVNCRTRIAIERERRQGLGDTLDRLPPGTQVIETHADGFRRVIRGGGRSGGRR